MQVLPWREMTVGTVLGAVLVSGCGRGADDAVTTTGLLDRGENTTPSREPSRATEPPERWVGIDDQGRLVVVDSGSGDVERVLGEFDHPEECPPQGEPVAGCQWVVDVAVSPDGQEVYYETCCEPAPGTIHRVPIAGGDPEVAVHGAHPALDPDGQRLAFVELQWVAVHPLAGDEDGARFASPHRQPAALHGMAWSPDGDRLAFTLFEEIEGPGVLHLLDVGDAGDLDDARPVAPDEPPASWTLPAFREDGMLVVVEQDMVLPDAPEGSARRLVVDPTSGEVGEETDLEESVLSQRYDPTGTHLIWVSGDGSVTWSNQAGERTVLEESGYTAAAW